MTLMKWRNQNAWVAVYDLFIAINKLNCITTDIFQKLYLHYLCISLNLFPCSTFLSICKRRPSKKTNKTFWQDGKAFSKWWDILVFLCHCLLCFYCFIVLFFLESWIQVINPLKVKLKLQWSFRGGEADCT